MPTSSHQVLSLLKARGISSASELASSLKVSQPTVSRLISQLPPSDIIRIGRGPATRYAARYPIRHYGSHWPLYELNPSGQAHHVGDLHALSNKAWHLELASDWPSLRSPDNSNFVYPDLPWFLEDLRPQGFLGRNFVSKYATQLGTPASPQLWTAEHILSLLLEFGSQLPGSFVLGDSMLNSIQSSIDYVSHFCGEGTRDKVYPALASTVLQGEWPGSSAAGEQPKFTTSIKDHSGSFRDVIVKFSGTIDSPAHQRRADLLVAECIASGILIQNDIPAAHSELIIAQDRYFLESTRFDRIGENGRRGLCSLHALDAAFYGELETPWTSAATRLQRDGWVTTSCADRLRLLWRFGMLIGNTDMHYGNISLFLTPKCPLELAPTYDMLPMLYAPNAEGGVTHPLFTFPRPSPQDEEEWSQAAIMAETLWVRVSEDERVSEEFKRIADDNAEIVKNFCESLLR